jgi:hypothetical protein
MRTATLCFDQPPEIVLKTLAKRKRRVDSIFWQTTHTGAQDYSKQVSSVKTEFARLIKPGGTLTLVRDCYSSGGGRSNGFEFQRAVLLACPAASGKEWILAECLANEESPKASPIRVGNLSRIPARPSKWTFRIPQVQALLERYKVGKGWVDPFAGETSPAALRNDVNTARPAESHQDANVFLTGLDRQFRGLLYDPPWSQSAGQRHYGVSNTPEYMAECRELCAKLVTNGLIIAFGWRSDFFQGLGFTLEEVCILAHPGNMPDTLVTVWKQRTAPPSKVIHVFCLCVRLLSSFV